ncbi:hypothetical protein HF324_20945 [Chitinophaga oryzae]|uniref:DUF4843 domain-containing protein n=1 Tax=Chitinophaga oryzae TaxID=2725414 RepID=A0AAE6ZI56_9BACT|nr:hypothetical protein [Chitinophaga oryzae]QJB33666.1 hypothetical protein HF329_21045 [Chitinophaga oryzae]QJB40192.1 hypothetical protein HF324_20945 [Chitinophaga oryzae]
MKVCKTSWLLTGIVAFVLAACNKDNDNLLYKKQVLPIVISGYNATQEALTVKVDTFYLSTRLGGGSFKQGSAFTFGEHQHTVKVSITEESSGKLVLEKEFTKQDSVAAFNFLYMDGKASNMPEKPAVEKEKISLVYMFIPNITQYSEPVDFVIGKYFVVPKVFEEVTRIKNVKPNEFSPPATFSTFLTGRQEYNGVITSVSFQVRIYKTGTNTPYVDGTAYTWNDISTSAPKPAASVAASKLYIFSEAPSGNLMRFFTRLDY